MTVLVLSTLRLVLRPYLVLFKVIYPQKFRSSLLSAQALLGTIMFSFGKVKRQGLQNQMMNAEAEGRQSIK